MRKNKYITKKIFSPLDDLYVLLESMEKILNLTIDDNDYVIGRKQLFYIFLHETGHAFITKSARWIHELKEDETDFVDEVVVRILIDDLIKKLNIYDKLDIYYENHVNHKKELINYGFNLSEENYLYLERIWYEKYSKDFKIEKYCQFVLDYYKNNNNSFRKT